MYLSLPSGIDKRAEGPGVCNRSTTSHTFGESSKCFGYASNPKPPKTKWNRMRKAIVAPALVLSPVCALSNRQISGREAKRFLWRGGTFQFCYIRRGLPLERDNH